MKAAMKYGGLLLLVACSPTPDPAVADCNELKNHVSVIVDGRCGGVIVTTNALLTAEHCVHAQELAYETCDGVTDTASVLSMDVWMDLAELRTEQSFERLSYRRLPFSGERVTMVHHRCAGGWCHERGDVVWRDTSLGEGRFECDCEPNTGISGSGVFGEDDALVGIVTEVGTESGDVYFALVDG